MKDIGDGNLVTLNAEEYEIFADAPTPDIAVGIGPDDRETPRKAADLDGFLVGKVETMMQLITEMTSGLKSASDRILTASQGQLAFHP